MTENKTFKIIGDGVELYFSKAFDAETKGLKKQLWHWYLKAFQFSRCEFDKRLDVFSVYYRDAKTENLRKKLLQYRSSVQGQGIDLIIKLSGDLISEPKEKFVGSEYLACYDGLTQFVYNEFFTTEVKSMTQSANDSAYIESIINYGKISTKSIVDDIMTEWQNPVKTGLPKEVLLK